MKGKKAKVILAAYKKCRKYPSTFKLKYLKNKAHKQDKMSFKKIFFELKNITKKQMLNAEKKI